MQSIILNLARGVNRFADPIVANDGEAWELKNLYPTKLGLLSVRPAMAEEDRVGAAWTDIRALLLSKSRSAGAFYCVSGGARIINQDTLADAGVRLVYGVTAYSDLILHTTNRELSAIQLVDLGEDVVMLASPEFTPVKTNVDTLTSSAVTFTGAPPAGFKPHLAAVVGQRVVYACKNYLVWSDRQEPYVVGGSWPLDPHNPADITAIFVVSTDVASSPAQEALVVCTEHAAYLVSGAPDESTETQVNAPTASRFNSPAGCISQATVAQTSRGMMWCGLDDVWLYTGGQPNRVGTKLRPEIATLPHGLRWKAHAAWNPHLDCYQLALPKEGQDLAESSPLGNHWCLDLRGQELAWFGPMQYTPYKAWTSAGESVGTSVLITDRRNGARPRMFSLVPCRALPPSTDLNSHVALVNFEGVLPVDSAHALATEESPDRLPSTAYSVGDIVMFNHWAWQCTVAGTTSADASNVVFANCQGGSFFLGTGTLSVTDGTVTWSTLGANPDYYNMIGNIWQASAAPRFLPSSMYHNGHVLFDIKGRQYVGETVKFDKRPEKLLLTYNAPAGARVAAHMLPWTQGAVAPGVSKALLPSSGGILLGLPNGGTERLFINEQIRVPYNYRQRAKHVQPRLSNRNGFIIGSHNDRLFIHWAAYSTINAVWPMFAPALETYDSGQLTHQELDYAGIIALLDTHIAAAIDQFKNDTGTAPCTVVYNALSTAYEHLPVLEYTVTAPLATDAQDIDQQWFRLGFYGTKFASINLTWDPSNLIKQMWWAALLGGGHGSFEQVDYVGAYGGGFGPVTPEVVRMPSFWYSQHPTNFDIASLELQYHVHEREARYL